MKHFQKVQPGPYSDVMTSQQKLIKWKKKTTKRIKQASATELLFVNALQL